MDFHAFMYATIGRRHELERGMAGKDPVLYQRICSTRSPSTPGLATPRAASDTSARERLR
jgi:hypothetical protein